MSKPLVSDIFERREVTADKLKNFALENVIRTEGDGLQKAVSDATAIDFSNSPSLTQQSFVDECDINNIMARFEATGILPENPFEPRFGDATIYPEYHEAQNIMAEAHETFAALPAKIRERFHNDPAEYLSFFSDDNNLNEAISLGLINPLPGDQEAPVVTGATTPTGDS